MSKQNSPFVLVDGSSYIFRAFHAMPESMTNSKRQPTGAIYGVINMLKKLLADYQPEQIAVVFDAKGKTFRNDMYPEYKANRPPMPEELRSQIEPIHNIVKALGLPMLVVEGVEADDVIGTLAVQATGLGIDTVISTGDKDMAQLVNQHVSLVNTMTDTHSDVEGVKEKFGVPPELITDYLALIGDKVDNVPGVNKCGPKTAVKWLDQFGSIEGVMEHADEIKGKVGEYLREALDYLPLSHELVKIKCDVPLEQGPQELLRSGPDNEALKALYSEYEFKSWLAALLKTGESVSTSAASVSHSETAASPERVADYQVILTQPEFEAWLDRLNQAELFAFDTETTSLDYMQAEIVGVSFAIQSGEAAYVPVAHDYPGAPEQLNRDDVLHALKPLLEDPNQAKLGQHLKYDMNVLSNYGIHMQGIAHDTMLESYVLDSTATRHDMDSLSLKYLGHKTIKYEEVAGKGAKQLTFNQVDLEQAGPYAAEDADITLRLHQALWPRLQHEASLQSVYEAIEMPLVAVLSHIERNGVLVDAHQLKIQSGELARRMMELEQQAHELAGEAFNLGSPKQLQAILFEKLELPVIAKTPKGQPSTAENVLVELAEQGYELPQTIIEYRSVSKLKSTYTDKLPELIQSTGRIHTSYHQAVAATGRLSSSDPNLQNIPVRSEEGRRIRKAFIAPKGYKIVSADYSQIELRIMAHLSDDPGLLQAFNEGADVHKATAAEVFGVALDEVTSDQRRSAKAINFGLIYGMSAFGLAKQLGIARSDAQEYVNLYFERYPGVKTYMDSTRELARQQGYVETVFGRRLYLPEINASNAQRRQYAERTAINAPMQGTAADIIKRAMLAVDAWLQQGKMDARMIMQVHDELVFEVAEAEVENFAEEVSRLMAQAAELKVPLVVEPGSGENWEEAH
ncbi:MAG: DNA polymerase I [Gammaproteobacteria bacterium]|nr:DNA polymerase I [Gammaproteobacteria bacterium]